MKDNTATLERQIDAPRKVPSGMKPVTVVDENEILMIKQHINYSAFIKNILDSISTRRHVITCQ